jgi:hypothetical protein
MKGVNLDRYGEIIIIIFFWWVAMNACTLPRVSSGNFLKT